MAKHRIKWTTRYLLVLTALIAIGLALNERRSRFLAAIEGHQTASAACQKAAFRAVKWGGSPSAVFAISAAGERHRQAALLHNTAIWRPWVLFSPQPVEGDSIQIVDDISNTTTQVSIRTPNNRQKQ